MEKRKPRISYGEKEGENLAKIITCNLSDFRNRILQFLKIIYAGPHLDFHSNVAKKLNQNVMDKSTNSSSWGIISSNLVISKGYWFCFQSAAPSMAASPSSLSLLSSFKGRQSYNSKALISQWKPVHKLSFPIQFSRQNRNSLIIMSSVSVSSPEVRTGRPDDLVASILSKVSQTDGGVSLTKEEHEEVSEVAQQLQRFCVAEPVKSPLIFGDWDVVYCSRPTSPGGGYRSAFGRLFFKTKQMIQAVEAPDIVRNKVSFSLFGFLDGEVSLKGQLKVLDESWIQVIFEAPELKVGALEFRYGGQSEVKLQISYIDEKIRLGKGSRGSLFVFQRCI
ncbi:LOW QUALITY PROTEIN: probable plastid-lipid-associated protein 8, chloroplastic [Mercurialis annua]|uniref:LOW QUALITY PROTEIN: probable plastid-lipid-associated protein 8, chloroplastic n=1 Tax=Mercurialis annua TaxID=3986 RepID=UPI0021600AF8|nr:LOW QUALITY PROTEIN: probable plastid-lipid-associated protein 8, chloroplastic [Mercurialis annua]